MDTVVTTLDSVYKIPLITTLNVAQLLLIHVSLEVHLDTTQLETVHTGTVLV
jgi:hypothetical protein